MDEMWTMWMKIIQKVCTVSTLITVHTFWPLICTVSFYILFNSTVCFGNKQGSGFPGLNLSEANFQVPERLSACVRVITLVNSTVDHTAAPKR